jgi:hypothetical protein
MPFDVRSPHASRYICMNDICQFARTYLRKLVDGLEQVRVLFENCLEIRSSE